MRKWIGAVTKGLIMVILVFTSIRLQDICTESVVVEAAVKTPKIELIKYSDYLNIGEDYTFQAKVTGAKEKITWSVSDQDTATITSKGKLSALKAGTVIVYAKAGNVQKKCKVTIGTGRISVLSNDLTLYEDTTLYINVRDSLDDELIHYELSNKSVVLCEWGEWVDDTVALKMTVVGVGKETIEISTNRGKEKLFVHLTVKKQNERKELTAKEIYKKCGPSTVEITAVKAGDTFIGSGFFVEKNKVVTNYHVISGASQITITMQDMKKFTVSRILGYDAMLDLVILEVDAKGYEPLKLSSSDVSVGESVYALGSPLGLTGTMTDGMVSSASRVIEGVNFIQITAPISQGNSGGPLVNVYGEVVGVNTMYYEDGQNLNFSIDVQELTKIDTNHSLTVADYSEQYWKSFYEYVETNFITEDSALSQNTRTCQEIPPHTKTIGTIMASESLKGDVYRFKITEEGWYLGCILFNTKEDLNNAFFDLYDSDIERIASSKKNEDRLMLYTMYYLTPGDYYVFACVSKDYVGTDISYSMVLTY